MRQGAGKLRKTGWQLTFEFAMLRMKRGKVFVCSMLREIMAVVIVACRIKEDISNEAETWRERDCVFRSEGYCRSRSKLPEFVSPLPG